MMDELRVMMSVSVVLVAFCVNEKDCDSPTEPEMVAERWIDSERESLELIDNESCADAVEVAERSTVPLFEGERERLMIECVNDSVASGVFRERVVLFAFALRVFVNDNVSCAERVTVLESDPLPETDAERAAERENEVVRVSVSDSDACADGVKVAERCAERLFECERERLVTVRVTDSVSSGVFRERDLVFAFALRVNVNDNVSCAERVTVPLSEMDAERAAEREKERVGSDPVSETIGVSDADHERWTDSERESLELIDNESCADAVKVAERSTVPLFEGERERLVTVRVTDSVSSGVFRERDLVFAFALRVFVNDNVSCAERVTVLESDPLPETDAERAAERENEVVRVSVSDSDACADGVKVAERCAERLFECERERLMTECVNDNVSCAERVTDAESVPLSEKDAERAAVRENERVRVTLVMLAMWMKIRIDGLAQVASTSLPSYGTSGCPRSSPVVPTT